MAVEIISWPISTKECCWTWGSNPGPSPYQMDAHPIELPCPAHWLVDACFMSWGFPIWTEWIHWWGLPYPWFWYWMPNLQWISLQSRSQEPHLSCLMTKPTKWLCAQRRLRSTWASAQSDQSLLSCTQWVAKDPSFLHADSEDWSDRVDAQANLSLCWAHISFCWFCREAAHLMIHKIQVYSYVVLISKVPVFNFKKFQFWSFKSANKSFTTFVCFKFNLEGERAPSPPKFTKRNRNQTTDGMFYVNSNITVL